MPVSPKKSTVSVDFFGETSFRGPPLLWRPMSRIAGGPIAGGLLCVFGAVYMSYLGLANIIARSGEIASLLSAAKLTPDDASLWQRAGLKLLEIAPDRAHEYLERAIQLNPRDADALLGLAFVSEKSGQAREAEMYSLKATRVSRRYRPNYSLATYYFRQDSPALFWATAARAAAIDRANLENLFRVAHLMSDSPRQVPGLLKLESQHARTSYLTFLLQEENLDKMDSLANLDDAAQRIHATALHQDLLLAACERLLDAGRTVDAARIWNRLGAEGGAAFTRLDPSCGPALANGAFLPAPMRAFNWRSSGAAEVTLHPHQPSGLRIEFSGRQAEAGTVLNQPLLLLPGARYRLTYRSDVSGLSSTEGLHWAVVAAQQIRARSPWGTGSSAGAFEFHAPREPASLVLLYARSPGTVRMRGSLILQSAELQCLP